METGRYNYTHGRTLMQLYPSAGRWYLKFNGRDLCNYGSLATAVRFVAHGRTGDQTIDRMEPRPQAIGDWERA